MRPLWFKTFAVLAAVWAVAGGVIFWARSAQPTPASIARYLAAHPVQAKPAREREQVLRKVADQMNRLEYEQRREMRMGKSLDGFFRSLTPDEQAQFLDLTLPTGFRQMMDAFNKMEPEKRKRIVEKALTEMRAHEGETPAPRSDDPNVQKIVQQGLHSFYTDASADVKLDLAPLIEQMQKNLQGL